MFCRHKCFVCSCLFLFFFLFFVSYCFLMFADGEFNFIYPELWDLNCEMWGNLNAFDVE